MCEGKLNGKSPQRTLKFGFSRMAPFNAPSCWQHQQETKIATKIQKLKTCPENMQKGPLDCA
jgi:hypothetical protein